MYIEPDGEIRILKGCPLEPGYEHTLYFDDKTAQTNYFISLTKYTLTGQSYTRWTRGVLRVQLREADVYDCSYLMFRNTAFSGRWFYAFINAVEYVNNITTEISFTIDVMQTFFFDYKLMDSFVEREHSATDIPGENTQPENLELGPVIYRAEENPRLYTSSSAKYVYYLLATESPTGDHSYNVNIAGIYNGLYTTYYTDWTALNNQIQAYINNGREESIINIYVLPSALPVTYEGAGTPNTLTLTTSSGKALRGYYSVKNNKLMTYPYNYLVLDNGAGQTIILRYELFNNALADIEADISIGVSAVCSPTPEAVFVPANYRGLNFDWTSSLSTAKYPSCAFSGDTYKIWWAQNQTAYKVDMVANYAEIAGYIGGAIATGGATAITGFGGAVSAAKNIAGLLAQKNRAEVTPDSYRGTVSQNVLGIANNRTMQLNAYNAGCNQEYLQIIDDYFSRYGYATNLIKKPNRNVRPHWTYTKTVGCKLDADCPASVEAEICAIYDAGITFWKNPAEVGDYSLNNAPSV